MKVRLKPLAEQVTVITGASSGIGLCTARLAAAKGAKVMLAARDEAALRRACEGIAAKGGTAGYFVADVADQAQVEALAEATIGRFGGFDTWVNNAGSSVYGELLETPLADHRQVFETNYWGVVHGSLVAVRYLRDRPSGGALINLGSTNSDMAAPILGTYNASKHAVKGFTDSLRIELLAMKAPVSVTLIKPSALGTPFPEHGRNLTGYKASLPEPLYAPEVAARAILHAAQHQRRSVTVGGVGKVQVLGATLMPALFDRISAKMRAALVDRSQPVGEVPGNLYEPQGNDGEVEGRQHGRHFSLFTAAGRHSFASLGIVAGLGAAGALALRHRVRS